MTAFNKILTNEKFKLLLGTILRFGNCLNAGNRMKGQADGFPLANLGTTLTMKDPKGNSILKICC